MLGFVFLDLLFKEFENRKVAFTDLKQLIKYHVCSSTTGTFKGCSIMVEMSSFFVKAIIKLFSLTTLLRKFILFSCPEPSVPLLKRADPWHEERKALELEHMI